MPLWIYATSKFAMQPHMLRDGKHFQIFGAIVPFVVVLVVHYFTAKQWAAQHIFSHDSMKENSSAIDANVFIAKFGNPHVPAVLSLEFSRLAKTSRQPSKPNYFPDGGIGAAEYFGYVITR